MSCGLLFSIRSAAPSERQFHGFFRCISLPEPGRSGRAWQGIRPDRRRVPAGPVHRRARHRHRHARAHRHPGRPRHHRPDERVDHHRLHAGLRRGHPGDGQAGRPLGAQAHIPGQHRAVRCGVAFVRPCAGRGKLLDAVGRASRAGGRRRRHRAGGHRGVRNHVPSREARVGAGPGGRRLRHRQHLRRIGRQLDALAVRPDELAVHLLRERSHLRGHRRRGGVRAAEHACRGGEAHRRLWHRGARDDGARAAVRPEEPPSRRRTYGRSCWPSSCCCRCSCSSSGGRPTRC